MKYYYRARLQYDGTGYFGFQWQKDLRTIQGDINQVLASLTGVKTTTMGASRTDTGVHALEQWVKITTETEIDGARLNDLLPPQIRCLSIEPCSGSFRPSSDCVSKEYRYLFTNTLGTDGSDRRFIANNPFPLNLEAMKKCVEAVVGERDFRNFVSTGSNVSSTVRLVTGCDISVVNPKELLSDLFPSDVETCYQLRIVGEGFLKQMIRHLVAALWKVGNGRLSEDEFLSLLHGPKRAQVLWKVAPAKGLFLYRIDYAITPKSL